MSAVVEGGFILPEIAGSHEFDGQANGGRVRAPFVYEQEEARIADNFAVREGGDQPLRAHTSWLKVRWLREECARLGVPQVAARPWDSLVQRAADAASKGGRCPRLPMEHLGLSSLAPSAALDV